jgi:hypothetical protein
VRRHAKHIWNLQLLNPNEDNMQHLDDINADFQQILYHPELAPIFVYVFMELILIHVGLLFVSQSTPLWWCQPAEGQAHSAAVLGYLSSIGRSADHRRHRRPYPSHR